MIYLFLTIVCSTSIALILKQNDVRNGHPLVLLCANYGLAALISWGFLITGSPASVSIVTTGAGILLAGMFVGSFFAFAKAVQIAGTALAQISSRLSVVVPTLLSILFFSESPRPMQLAGILLTFVTLYLFYLSLTNGHRAKLQRADLIYLLAVLLGIGINDFSMKVFQHWRPAEEKSLFLTSIFTASFVLTAALIRLLHIRIDKATIRRGSLLGVPNVFSTFFLIGALQALPAIVVFPVVNIGVILLTAAGAFLIWRERLNRYGILASIAGMLAILLLSSKP